MIRMLMEREPAPIIDVSKPALPKRVDILATLVIDPAADLREAVPPPVEPMSDAAREMLEHTLRSVHAVKESVGITDWAAILKKQREDPKPVRWQIFGDDAKAPGTEPATDGWIEWKGGRCPVAGDAIIEYKFRDGRFGGIKATACMLRWSHVDQPGDIMAYRVVG